MRELTYLTETNKEKTGWTGARKFLYDSLSEYYSLNAQNTSMNRWLSIFIRHGLGVNKTIFEYHRRNTLRKKFRNLKGKVFQFNDILFNEDGRETYMYVDLTMSYLNYMKNNISEVYKMSGFQKSDSATVERWAKEQDYYISSCCSGLFTMSNWLRKWLISQGLPSSKIYTVGGGNSVNPELICSQHRIHNRILFIGMDFKRKGGFITYEAFKLLREQGENVELYVIGPTSNPIKNPVDGYHFVGNVSFDEEAKYYNMCDLFCMPSYFEAYGLVFVEALTFGLPCIGRNCYEMPYFIKNGDTGLLLKEDNPQELASLMYKGLHDNNMTNNVKDLRSEYLQDYSWSSVAERIAKVID